MLRKIARWINKEVIHSEIIISNALFLSGAIIFNSLIGNKIGGKYFLLILSISYLILGIGLYGIFKWLARNGFRLLLFLIRLILCGNIEVTIAKEKVSFKTHFNK